MLLPMELQDSSVRLRKLRDSDAEILFDGYFSQPDAALYVTRSVHASLAETQSVLNRWCAWDQAVPQEKFGWIIALDRDEPVGVLYAVGAEQIIEVHYGVCKSHWGLGIATAAVRLASDWLLSQSSVSEVATAVDSEHLATQRVLEKAGFRRAGWMANHLVLPKFDPLAARDAIRFSRKKGA